MLRNGFGVLLCEGFEFIACNAIQLVDVDIEIDDGVVMVSTNGTKFTCHTLLFGHLLFDETATNALGPLTARAKTRVLGGT